MFSIINVSAFPNTNTNTNTNNTNTPNTPNNTSPRAGRGGSGEHRSIKSVLIVTHNIEEAVQMADRVVVLGSHPGHLIADVPIDLPRPRDRHAAAFEEKVDMLYSILTGQSRNDESNEE